ncbi:MAG TPA: hypothetical protein DD706_23250, partial [Nitrospiraceae bacterium]|nr:hypothetical protein [Nitrospiraceae bacterium]
VLTPNGYLVFQLPIGHFQDVPLEDTIGIRSYPNQEIEECLRRNGLGFLHPLSSHFECMDSFEPHSHQFRLAQKICPMLPAGSMDWDELEQPHFVSELDAHLYAVYADDCVRAGNHPEGIHTLQILVNKNPDYLAGWLRLAALLIETGQLPQALVTMKEITALHPDYQEGHRMLKQLIQKCPNLYDSGIYSLSASQHFPGDPSRDFPALTDREYF